MSDSIVSHTRLKTSNLEARPPMASESTWTTIMQTSNAVQGPGQSWNTRSRTFAALQGHPR
eukprot:15474178-Alexandrium_andersonii.AAC.1